ncbi:hypothetical protein T05_12456 [Trichinella murrelli]|uniref:Uncharacterized protein n=1 Tax=Trichinella murrelli TaxID=144512 RepID=A0A0V0T5S6_9BILA|nr:hypothetical protein T05_12456 [Trichinella murrelli]
MSSASMGRSVCPHWHLGMFAALRTDKGKDSVNPMTAWVLTKINGISRSTDSWVVNANHTVRNYQLLHWFAIADD